MCNPPLDNGEYFMRRYGRDMFEAQRLAQMQHARNEYFSELFGEALRRAQQTGERPAEDVTGLRLLEEFLAKRKGERDGDERK